MRNTHWDTGLFGGDLGTNSLDVIHRTKRPQAHETENPSPLETLIRN